MEVGGGHTATPHHGLCWDVARAWEGLGRADPSRGSPAGNLQHHGCFVIPWTIFRPPPWVFLQAGDNGAELCPSCESHCPLPPAPGEGNSAAGKGLTFGPVSHAVPASLLGGEKSP